VPGFRPDAKNGDDAAGEVDLRIDVAGSSGSNIKAKEDWASVDLVGTGA